MLIYTNLQEKNKKLENLTIRFINSKGQLHELYLLNTFREMFYYLKEGATLPNYLICKLREKIFTYCSDENKREYSHQISEFQDDVLELIGNIFSEDDERKLDKVSKKVRIMR